MNILVLVILLILVFDAYALPHNCYIVSVGPPEIHGDSTYYSVRRVCYDKKGGYRVQESDYTVEQINAENFEPDLPPPIQRRPLKYSDTP